MSDLDRLLAQVEELKKLATRPDDSWMTSMSTEELKALGKRVRKVADGLTGLQSQLQRQAPNVAAPAPMPPRAASAGSLGSMVRRDTSATTPPPAAPSGEQPRQGYNPLREAMESRGLDMSNPMQRRRGAVPHEGATGAGRPVPRREEPPSGPRHGSHRPNF